MISRRKLLATTLGGASALLTTRSRSIAQVSDRPTRIIVGFAAGGSLDAIARILAGEMKDVAPTIIVDNRPGAAGTHGWEPSDWGT